MENQKELLSKDSIIELYTDYILTHDEQPKSVYTFAKMNNFSEADFYQFYGTFEAIENDIFTMLFLSSKALIQAAPEYVAYNAKEKVLAFYYTFFENLTANRSLVKYLLQGKSSPLANMANLKGLRTEYMEFISELDIDTLDLKEERIQKLQEKALQESAWGQLLGTIKFWLDDQSAGFEKTDIFIEKSVNTSFELMNIKPIKSLIDLGKFVFQERAGLFTKTSDV